MSTFVGSQYVTVKVTVLKNKQYRHWLWNSKQASDYISNAVISKKEYLYSAINTSRTAPRKQH